MTTTPTSTAIALAVPVFSNAERLALAGFLAGHTGGLRSGPRQYASWCQQPHLRLFQAPRATQMASTTRKGQWPPSSARR